MGLPTPVVALLTGVSINELKHVPTDEKILHLETERGSPGRSEYERHAGAIKALGAYKEVRLSLSLLSSQQQ